MGLLGVALAMAPGLARAQPANLYFERSVMMAADVRCALFAPPVSAALAMGAAQARGAALRGGVDPRTLQTLEDNAQDRGDQTDCASDETLASARRVESAFAAFGRQLRMTLPGDVAVWRADRAPLHQTRWWLTQESRFEGGRMTFGLVGRDTPGILLAVVSFRDDASPYAARLLIRDTRGSLGPYLYRPRDRGPTRPLPLNRRTPPRGAMKAYSAEARSPAGLDLLAEGAGPGWAFRFPIAAAADLAELDPREAVIVEFLFPGEKVRRAYVEVGDFAAGRAFLRISTR
jgi:hypothetical protein